MLRKPRQLLAALHGSETLQGYSKLGLDSDVVYSMTMT